MGGCIYLLQVWSWERLHIGCPTLQKPASTELNGKSLAYRWNNHYVRDVRPSSIIVYRDEIDSMLQSQILWEPYTPEIILQLPPICTSGSNVWRARVPIICWHRVEWHLPDRVMRQFGFSQRIDMEPMDPNYKRVDPRGKSDQDWMRFYASYITLWENRRSFVIEYNDGSLNEENALREYMRWYRSWASLYLLQPPIELPSTYYPRGAVERKLRHCVLQIEEISQSFFGVHDDDPRQKIINQIEEICGSVRRSVFVDDDRYDAHSPTDTQSHSVGLHMAPSPVGEVPPCISGDHVSPTTINSGGHTIFQMYPGTSFVPTPPGMGPITSSHHPIFWMPPPFMYQGSSFSTQTSSLNTHGETSGMPNENPNVCGRTRRPPDNYTPGSDAVRRRHKRR